MDSGKVNRTVRRIVEARLFLIRESPFFGHLAMRLGLACAPCETACTDGSRLIFDPEFAEQLSDRELQFVTLHEVLHCVLEHCTRSKGLDSFLYNQACDRVVNSTILEMWGMDSMTVRGETVMHLAPDGQEGRLYNAEEIYQMLLRGPKSTRGPERVSGGGIRSTANASPGTFLPEDASPGAALDRHDLWQGIIHPSQLRDMWNGWIQEAAKLCGDSAGMPQSIRRVVQVVTERAGLNWRQLLHDFLQFDQYDYTFLPPDRRYSDADFYLPAYQPEEEHGSASDLWVCVDTSGSISEEELSCAMEEVLDAMRQTGLKGKISFFDSNLTEPAPFESEADLQKITPTGGGGTSFQVIFRYLREKWHSDLPKAILVLTDGYAEWPQEREAMGVPVLWLISKEGKNDVPWGRWARM